MNRIHGVLTRNANLRGANLLNLVLDCFDFSGADLRNADLRNADLLMANLEGANLEGANIEGANLEFAKLSDDTVMPDGRRWADYRADHLSGISIFSEVRSRAMSAWGKHEWEDCPVHAALGINGLDEIPSEAARLRIATWMALYDSGILYDLEPMPYPPDATK